MLLHLAVPGLLWPAESLREAARDLELPALYALLGRGVRRIGPPAGLSDWIARSFGLGDTEIPWGALRRLGEADGSDSEGDWLCADPVHLRFARDTLVLADARELAITAEEAQALVASLNAHFGAIGRFHASAPTRWYLRPSAKPELHTQPLERVVGRSFELFLPEGADATRWRAILNEAQMLLHAHPVNAVREQRGQPTINSVWLWGAGSLQAWPAPAYAEVRSDHPVVIGAARACGLPCAPLPERAPTSAAHPGMLAVIDSLQGAAAYRDLSAWRGALAQLERDWFAPLLGSLYAGSLRELRISAPGDEATLDIGVTGRDRWKLWRRPLALGELAAELGRDAAP